MSGTLSCEVLPTEKFATRWVLITQSAVEPGGIEGPKWYLTEEDIDAIGIGAAVMGSGGGGSPAIGVQRAKHMLRTGHRIAVMRNKSLPEEALVVPVGFIGAPAVILEKLPAGNEITKALDALEAHIQKKVGSLPQKSFCSKAELGLIFPGRYTVVDLDGLYRYLRSV